MLFGGKVCCFVFEQGIGKQLLLYLCEADAVNGVREAFARQTLVAEEQDGFFDGGQNFFFARKELIHRLAMPDFFAPAPAKIDFAAIDAVIEYMEGAGMQAAPAAVAEFFMQYGLLPAFLSDCMDRTSFLWLAEAAGFALGKCRLWCALSDDANIVEVGFYTVIWTAANGNLE